MIIVSSPTSTLAMLVGSDGLPTSLPQPLSSYKCGNLQERAPMFVGLPVTLPTITLLPPPLAIPSHNKTKTTTRPTISMYGCLKWPLFLFLISRADKWSHRLWDPCSLKRVGALNSSLTKAVQVSKISELNGVTGVSAIFFFEKAYSQDSFLTVQATSRVLVSVCAPPPPPAIHTSTPSYGSNPEENATVPPTQALLATIQCAAVLMLRPLPPKPEPGSKNTSLTLSETLTQRFKSIGACRDYCIHSTLLPLASSVKINPNALRFIATVALISR